MNKVSVIRRKISLTLSILFFYSLAAISHSYSPLIINYTTKDGLPSSEVHSILQAKNGLIWFATDRGLASYNGYEFKSYSKSEGLSDISVLKLAEGKNGRIWMATMSGQIFYLENDSVYSLKCSDQLMKLSGQSMTLEIDVDSDGSLWVSVPHRGIFHISNQGDMSLVFKAKPTHDLNLSIHHASKEHSIGLREKREIGAPEYILEINGKITSIIREIDEVKRTFFTGSKELCFASIDSAIIKIENDSIKKIFYIPATVISLKIIKDELWVASMDGLYSFPLNFESNQYQKYLPGLVTTNVEEDKEGGFWISTLESGVFYMPQRDVINLTFYEDDRKFAMSGTSANGITFIGFIGGKIAKIQNRNISLLNKNDLYRRNFWPSSLYYDPANEQLMVSGSSSLHYFLGNKKIKWRSKEQMSESKIIDKDHLWLFGNVVRTKKGELYACGITNLVQIKTDSLIVVDKFKFRISCLQVWDLDNFLLGTTNGVFIYNLHSRKLTEFRNEFRKIRVDDMQWLDNKLFFATQGNGLLYLENGVVRTINVEQGLASSQINHLTIENNVVWCATNRGISKITFLRNSYTLENITRRNGLIDDEVRQVTINGDTIFAILKSGISIFHKGKSFTNKVAPPVSIAYLKINNLPVGNVNILDLPHDSNTINIGFLGVSISSDKKIKYKYLLTDGNYKIAGETYDRHIEFFYLPPSKYSFKVSAMNSSGLWSKNEAQLTFYIRPAWWQTLWTKLGVIALLTSIIFILYKRRLQSVQETFATEQHVAQMQLTALRAQMNPHFIFNVMNSIRHFYKTNEIERADKYLTSFSKLIRFSLDNSSTQEITLQDELTMLKNYAELEKQVLEQDTEFIVECESDIDCDEVKIPTLLLQPFVENSYKHGLKNLTERGKIKIHVGLSNNAIRIIIEDNGIGWRRSSTTDNRGHHSMGTSMTLKRIEAYNSAFKKNITVEIVNLSELNEGKSGTRVILTGF